MSYPESWTKPTLTPKQRENMERWCHELDTTDKEQVTGKLCRDGKYCCLGIWCELAASEGRLSRTVLSSGVVIYEEDAAALPKSEADALGVDDCTVCVPVGWYKGAGCRTAADLNDSAGLTFKEIAQVLRWAYLDGPRPEFYKEQA